MTVEKEAESPTVVLESLWTVLLVVCTGRRKCSMYTHDERAPLRKHEALDSVMLL
jgi:hypothetical protein